MMERTHAYKWNSCLDIYSVVFPMHYDTAEACIELFLFAEAYDIPKLRFDAINRLVHCFDTNVKATGSVEWFRTMLLKSPVVHHVYEVTNAESPLRKALQQGRRRKHDT